MKNVKAKKLFLNVKDFIFYKYICVIVYFGRYKIKLCKIKIFITTQTFEKNYNKKFFKNLNLKDFIFSKGSRKKKVLFLVAMSTKRGGGLRA